MTKPEFVSVPTTRDVLRKLLRDLDLVDGNHGIGDDKAGAHANREYTRGFANAIRIVRMALEPLLAAPSPEPRAVEGKTDMCEKRPSVGVHQFDRLGVCIWCWMQRPVAAEPAPQSAPAPLTGAEARTIASMYELTGKQAFARALTICAAYDAHHRDSVGKS